MKKRIAILSVMLISVTLCACTADDINSAVNQLGDKAGVDVELNLKDEDLDKIKDGAGKMKDTVTDITEDEDVREAVDNLIDAIEGAREDE